MNSQYTKNAQNFLHPNW